MVQIDGIVFMYNIVLNKQYNREQQLQQQRYLVEQ